MTGWPATLTLVRHGESYGNVANARAYETHALRLDLSVNDASVELTDLGVRQAQALGERLRDLDTAELPTIALVSSYVRARQTAEHILAAAGCAGVPQVYDERLRDREQGVLDRLTWWGTQERYPEEAERRRYLGKFWYRPPGGESWADVALRIRAVLLDLRLQYAGENVLVVSHDVPILLARYVLESMSPDEAVALSGQVRNCAVTTYRRGARGMELVVFNDVTPIVEDPEAMVTAHE
jgi:2,3-bisphosphoglycerate-dependent phosphoglycerate mutase